MRNFRSMGFGCSIRGHDAGNFLGDGRSVSVDIIGRTSGIKAIAEIFVEVSEERMDHGKGDAVDRPS